VAKQCFYRKAGTMGAGPSELATTAAWAGRGSHPQASAAPRVNGQGGRNWLQAAGTVWKAQARTHTRRHTQSTLARMHTLTPPLAPLPSPHCEVLQTALLLLLLPTVHCRRCLLLPCFATARCLLLLAAAAAAATTTTTMHRATTAPHTCARGARGLTGSGTGSPQGCWV